MKLPSLSNCLKKAYQLSVEVNEQKTITANESNNLLSKGETLPEELIFHTENIIRLIKYCQNKL